MRVDFEFMIGLGYDKDMLCFAKVSGISVSVEASDDEATAGTAAILPRNQVESQLVVDLSLLVKTIHDRSAVGCKLCPLEFAKQVVIESEVGDIANTVRPKVFLVL